MKKERIFLIILSTILISFNLAGCTKTANTNIKETPYYTLNIDGQKQFFDENDEEVKNINSFLDKYLDLSINLDYSAGGYLDQFDLCTDVIVASNKENGLYEAYEASIQEDELIRSLKSYEVTEVDFYEVYGQKYSTASVSYKSIISHASTDYLEASGKNLNEEYTSNISFKLLKQEDGWRIEQIL